MLLRLTRYLLMTAMLAGCLCIAEESAETLRLPALFTDHMVMQRGDKLPVWGWAAPESEITVTLAENTATTKADKDGKWKAWLPVMKAGGPYELKVKADKEIIVKDVLIGDVWVCGGQSNMEFPLARSFDAKKEISSANNPQIRLIKVKNTSSLIPQENFSGEWTTCTPENVGMWTAVGYYFAKYINQTQKIPVGLISSNWGGTRVEPWTSIETSRKLPEAANMIKELDEISGMSDLDKKKLKDMENAYKKADKELAALEKNDDHQAKYSDPSMDDSGWKDIQTPGVWNSQGWGNTTGEAWYRRTVEIPAEWEGKELVLSPGAVDEIESTFFNGKKIGSSGSYQPFNTKTWNKDRQYKVPASLVKAGKALIAVRVVNIVGGGGMFANGKPDSMFLKLADGSGKTIALKGTWKFKFAYEMPTKPSSDNLRKVVTCLYNGMIHPLLSYPIAGAIWYQGESNAGNAYDYRVLFPAMIQDWREKWGKEFPFLWVQLANFRAPQETPVADNWAVVRESQNLALKLPKTATGLAIDIGNASDIHPKNKKDVGYRLSLGARAIAYGEKDIVYSGPTFKDIKVEGDKIRVSFDSIGGGLVAKDGELKRFSIAGADQKFYWAKAVIDGDTVIVSADEVKEPVAVRYAFETNPEGCNLYNKEGLPASPFRSDDWNVPSQK